MQIDYADRREEIIHTALAIASEEGVHRLTMKNIGSRIGISDAALYRHFTSKHEIIRGMIELIGESLTTKLSGAVKDLEDPVQKLKGILQEHLAYLENNKGLPRIIFSESVHQHDPVLRKLVLKLVNNYLDFIRDILQQAKERGRIKQDTDIDAASHAFFGLVQATALLWSLQDFDYSIKDKADSLFEVYSKSIC